MEIPDLMIAKERHCILELSVRTQISWGIPVGMSSSLHATVHIDSRTYDICINKLYLCCAFKYTMYVLFACCSSNILL
jgi:hypothetical protein